MDHSEERILRAGGTRANFMLSAASIVPVVKGPIPRHFPRRRGGRRSVANNENAADSKNRAATTEPPLHLVPTVHSLQHHDDGSATLLEVEQRRLSASAPKAAIMMAPTHARPIRHLGHTPSAVASATVTSVTHLFLSAEIHAIAVEGGSDSVLLPMLTLGTASPSKAATVSKGTPRPMVLPVAAPLPDSSCSPATTCASGILAKEPAPAASAVLPYPADTFSRLVHPAHTVSEEEYAEVPCSGLLPSGEQELHDTISGSIAPSELGNQEPDLSTPAAVSLAIDTEASLGSSPTHLTPSAAAGCQGLVDLSTLALPREKLHPATLMYTNTSIARAIWREGFLGGVQEANAVLAMMRSSLHCGATCLPIPFDLNCPLLQLIAFHTPLMPVDAVAGATRWSELVLACPALYDEAVASGVLRMGLWGPLATPAGPAVVPAPLPLNFAAASPWLTHLLLACAWHEANCRESPYLTHEVHASGELAVAVGGKYNLRDLAEWLCAVSGPGHIDGLEAATASAAAAAGI